MEQGVSTVPLLMSRHYLFRKMTGLRGFIKPMLGKMYIMADLTTKLSMDRITITSSVTRHRVNRYSDTEQDPVKTFLIDTNNRFHIFQDTEEQISDQKSIFFTRNNSRQSTNHDKCAHVLHHVNTGSHIKQSMFSDIDEVFDNKDQQQHDTVLHSQEQGIPKHVLTNKHNCADLVACMNDNKEGYGFIPVSPFQLYTGNPTYYQNIYSILFIRLHKIVPQSGSPIT